MTPPNAVVDLLRRFPDEATCRTLFYQARWTDSPRPCVACGLHVVPTPPDAHGQVRCTHCGHASHLRAGTLLADLDLGLQTWLVAAHLRAHDPGLGPHALAHMLFLVPEQAIALLRAVDGALADPEHRRWLQIEADPAAVGRCGTSAPVTGDPSEGSA